MKFRSFLLNLSLLLLGAFLFAICQPNELFPEGLGFLAFFALIPYFVLVSRVSIKTSILWGGVYGAVAHMFLVFWLLDFSLPAFLAIGFLYFCFFAILTPLLVLVKKAYNEKAYLVQALLYLAYEFIKTSGFFGFSYGVLGYSQWKFLPLLQIASLFGVWAVSALLIFPASFFASFFVKILEEKKIKTEAYSVKTCIKNFFEFCFSKKLFIISYFAFLVLSLLLPLIKVKQANQVYKVALIQPNSDPWKSGLENYGRDLDELIELSTKALASDKNISLVVWPETAFIPRIKWHYRFRLDERFFALVDRLLNFLDEQTVPFIVGNDEALFDQSLAGTSDDLEKGRVDYNAALLFVPQKNVRPPEPEIYYKQKLVPLTEGFPFKKSFPKLYKLLLKADTHIYENGKKPTVFDVEGLKFSVPICFEDNFGYIARDFAKSGSQCLINISNDAWANSLACHLQHLSTSVFRAVETGLPVLRSTANGLTCYINENGKIVAKLPSFEKGFLVVDCEVPQKSQTLYTKLGDILGWAFVLIGGFLLVLAIIKIKIKE
ncbi:MAG: apolipoprotein N-acyltransferase [Treponemataceae bacterium]